jgi:hypothetical protein
MAGIAEGAPINVLPVYQFRLCNLDLQRTDGMRVLEEGLGPTSLRFKYKQTT